MAGFRRVLSVMGLIDPDVELEMVRMLRTMGYRVEAPAEWVEGNVMELVTRIHRESGRRPTSGRCGRTYWRALVSLANARCAERVGEDVPFIELHGVRFVVDDQAVPEAVYINGDSGILP